VPNRPLRFACGVFFGWQLMSPLRFKRG
jgi:hypothetical protein